MVKLYKNLWYITRWTLVKNTGYLRLESSKFLGAEVVRRRRLKRWKSKTRVMSYELRVQTLELRVQIQELRVQTHELRVQIHMLRLQIHELED